LEEMPGELSLRAFLVCRKNGFDGWTRMRGLWGRGWRGERRFFEMVKERKFARNSEGIGIQWKINGFFAFFGFNFGEKTVD
jgi:hypothetical protein